VLFNTIDYIFFFCFVVSFLVIVKNKQYQHLFLLGASYVFYYYDANYLISLLIASTLMDFYVGRAIYRSSNLRKKKMLLIGSLSGNLGMLGFFKYADFGIAQINNLGSQVGLHNDIPFLSIILPIGISFYTFASMTYTIDIFRGNLAPARSLKDYALFVAFFPQLVAGPIIRATDFLPQLEKKLFHISSGLALQQGMSEHVKLGITIMAFGFLKKMFFADNIAPMVNNIFLSPIGSDSLTIFLGTIAFGIQIYCDFSGYSDIAIGSALILGFRLPINFNKPYFASSPSDFWRKWHISLSTWLRDYLYIPLGGSRKSSNRTYVNLMITMFLGGLWHGASWNFVIWGLLHGTYLSIHRFIIQRSILVSYSHLNPKLRIILSILITQYLVFLAWIPFRVKNFDYVIYCMYKYVVPDFQIVTILGTLYTNRVAIILVMIFFIFHFISYRKKNLVERITSWRFPIWLTVIFGIIMAILLFFNGNPQDFIYFQF
jgi:alginate O-acetyltransferase complex protein AlgI